MRRWTLRIATTAALLIGVVPFQSKALTVGECYTIVERDYALCNSGPYNSFGQCENRRAERLWLVREANSCHSMEVRRTNVLREHGRSSRGAEAQIVA